MICCGDLPMLLAMIGIHMCINAMNGQVMVPGHWSLQQLHEA
jgi:hypothetical protein